MNPVLQRLALRAHPGTGGVRPRIASRFDWSTPAPLAPPADTGFAQTGSAEQTTAAPSHARASGIPHSPRTPSSHGDEMQQRPAPRSSATDQTTAIAAPRARDFDTLPHAMPMEVSVATEPPAKGQGPSRSAQEPDGNANPPRSVASALLLPDLAAPAEPVFVLSAPEGPETRRSLPEHHSDATLPDIHVTIGRIDITAEREQRAAPPPTAPPRPKLMSLEDYLAKGRSRR